jgi:CheY-like chemotaxis protein/two-component sensor histidine kinase
MQKDSDFKLSSQFFLSSISHELRTPLNGIVGYSQLLSQTKLDKNQKKYIKCINSCCLNLIELVNDILDFTRLTSNKVEIIDSYFNIQDLTEEIKSILSSRIEERNQKLIFIIDENIPKYISTDKKKLKQILMNIIGNSIKFTPDNGRIIINIENNSDSKLNFSLEDSGIGIDKKYHEKVFEPFFQIENDKITNSGSGLGLAICKRLLEILGEKIELESEPGQGTIFRFNYPYKKDERIVLNNSEINILKNSSFLIFENNIENRLELSEILLENESCVVFTTDKKEFQYLLSKKKNKYSLILVSKENYNNSKEIFDSLNIPFLIIGFSKKLKYINFPLDKSEIITKCIECLKFNFFEKHEEEKIKTNNNIKILISEDVSYNIDILHKMLNSLGYNNIDISKDGEDTLRKIQEKEYNVLFLDLKLPKKSGIEIAQFIFENNINIYICVITGSILDSDRTECEKYNVKSFILKPFTLSQIKNILKNIL